MSTAEPTPLQPGTLVHERYRVVAPVGQGGLGTVYQVTDVLYGRSNVYALKEQWDQSASARKQFEREAAWLKELDHRHIPKVIEYFDWNNRLYLVMDFVDGENLELKLERASGLPLPEAQVLGWIMPICEALQYMHTRKPPLIHRDVKPSNIIVTPQGHPVLVDLGIAKEHAPGANLTATFVRKAGTEGYAPPEQYSATGQTGPWSDVYSMGATMYQLLTTQIPPTAVERVALDSRMKPPRELNPLISIATNAAIYKALSIRPQDRFQSIADFKQALMAAAPAPLIPTSPASGPLVPFPEGVGSGRFGASTPTPPASPPPLSPLSGQYPAVGPAVGPASATVPATLSAPALAQVLARGQRRRRQHAQRPKPSLGPRREGQCREVCRQ